MLKHLYLIDASLSQQVDSCKKNTHNITRRIFPSFYRIWFLFRTVVTVRYGGCVFGFEWQENVTGTSVALWLYPTTPCKFSVMTGGEFSLYSMAPYLHRKRARIQQFSPTSVFISLAWQRMKGKQRKWKKEREENDVTEIKVQLRNVWCTLRQWR